MSDHSGKYALGSVEAMWRRRWRLALLAFLVPLTVVGALAVALPNLYRSTALVLVEPPPGSDAADQDARVRRLSEQGLSRSRREVLVARYDLYPNMRSHGSMEGAVERLRRDLRIERTAAESGGHNTAALEVSYQGRTPQTVANVAQDVAKFFVDEDCRQRSEDTAATIARLDNQLSEVSSRLAQEERRVRDFISGHLYELPQQAEANLAAVERLGGEMVRGHGRAAAAADDGPGEDDGADKLSRAKRALADLRSRYTDRYPEVQRLKDEVAALETQSRNDSAANRGRPDRNRPARDSSRDELQRAMTMYEERVYNAPKRQQELEALTLPYQSDKALHQSLSQEYEEARFRASLSCEAGATFRIADPAVPTKTPVAPDRMRLGLGGLMSSLLTAFLAVIIAEQLDTSFHARQELRTLTEAPLLASIPRIMSPRDRRRRRRHNALFAGLVAIALALLLVFTTATARDSDSLLWLVAHAS